MDIREAKYLLEIARTKSITKAANNLYITQPGLSKSLNKLEEEFDDPLFYREGNELFPTPMGKLVINQSQKIVHDFNAINIAVLEMKNKANNKLRISLPYSGSYLFTDIISDFTLEHPEVVLEPFELCGTQTADMFDNHELDVAFAMPMGSETKIELNKHLIMESEVMVGVTLNHPLASRETLSIKDLEGLEYISFDTASHIHKELNDMLLEEEVNAIPKMLGYDYLWLISSAKRTNTACILPKTYFEAFDDKDLILIPFEPKFRWPLCLAYPKELEESSVVHSFVEFVLKNLPEL